MAEGVENILFVDDDPSQVRAVCEMSRDMDNVFAACVMRPWNEEAFFGDKNSVCIEPNFNWKQIQELIDVRSGEAS